MIKAIDTQYAGCRFRSRLEARWAIIFDHLGIGWEYEPEGFETSAGWYLPDFRLNGSWVEIKGGSLTARDRARVLAFGAARWEEFGEKFRVLQGDIPRPGSRVVAPFPSHMGGPREIPAILSLSLVHDPEIFQNRLDPETKSISWKCLPGPTELVRIPWIPATAQKLTFQSLDEALSAARSARFEHGETPNK